MDIIKEIQEIRKEIGVAILHFDHLIKKLATTEGKPAKTRELKAKLSGFRGLLRPYFFDIMAVNDALIRPIKILEEDWLSTFPSGMQTPKKEEQLITRTTPENKKEIKKLNKPINKLIT